MNAASKEACLTRKQERILAWVRAFIERKGYPPTITEVADHYGIFRNAAEQHINAIVRKGRLRRIPKIARGLVLA